MVRASRFHRRMSRLAMLAVLLLALVPSVGRALGAGAPRVLADASALCTSTGLQLLLDGARGAGGLPGLPAFLHGDADCPYCPLAASIALPLLPDPLLPAPHAAMLPARRAAPRRRFRRLHGPGSRGPPILP